MSPQLLTFPKIAELPSYPSRRELLGVDIIANIDHVADTLGMKCSQGARRYSDARTAMGKACSIGNQACGDKPGETRPLARSLRMHFMRDKSSRMDRPRIKHTITLSLLYTYCILVGADDNSTAGG